MLHQKYGKTPMVVPRNLGVLWIYLMTVLSSANGIVMDHTINAPGHTQNFVDGINATDEQYLKG